MKDDLVGKLAEDLGGLVGLHDSFNHIFCYPWLSMVPQPPPRCWGEERYIVAAYDQGGCNCTGSPAPLSFSGVVPCVFHGWPVFAAPADLLAYWYGIGGGILGASSVAASCHGG